MLRAYSRLSQELEVLVHDVIGCCIAVHRELGPGLLEVVYSRALAVELRANNISFEREKAFPVHYRAQRLCKQQLDFVVASQLILEIKAVEQIADVHHSQLLHYMRLSKLPVGLLINFNVPVLKSGIVRKVLCKRTSSCVFVPFVPSWFRHGVSQRAVWPSRAATRPRVRRASSLSWRAPTCSGLFRGCQNVS
jgi:GxxExxY protein